MALPPSSPISQAAKKTTSKLNAHPLQSATREKGGSTKLRVQKAQNLEALATVEMARPRSEEFATPIASVATVAAELLGFSMLHPLLRRKRLQGSFSRNGTRKSFYSWSMRCRQHPF